MRKIILPKLWLAAIPKYWNEQIPDDYPTDTGSSFSLNYDSKEEKEAVKNMENNLGTEESIITDEMLPDNTVLGPYLGTYNVTGVAGEKVLLSPQKVSDKAVSVLAFHYTETTAESTENQDDSEAGEETTTPTTTTSWVPIEDVEIVDGYVYGTVESFSPIAVFEVKRDTYIDESLSVLTSKAFVANGIPIKIYKDESGNTIVEDGNGKKTTIDSTMTIIGGTLDGTSVESTSISVNGATIKSIFAGSYSAEDGKIVTVDTASVKIMDSIVTSGVVGCGYNNRLNSLDITARNSKVNFIGAGECYNGKTKKDSNQSFQAAGTLGLGANSWVKESKMTVENSDIWLIYSSGNSGYLYVDHSEIVAKDSKFDYFTSGGSNGGTNETEVSAENCTIKVFQNTNRGFVRSSKGELKDCTVEVCAVCGDPTDSSVDGTVDRVKLDLDGGKINLYAGTNGGVAVTAEVAQNIVESVKIGRDTEITYMQNADQILGDLIRFK